MPNCHLGTCSISVRLISGVRILRSPQTAFGSSTFDCELQRAFSTFYTLTMHEKKSKLLLKACLPWAAGSLAVFLSLLVLHSVYRSLPTPLSAIEAGNEKFSEQRFAPHLFTCYDYLAKHKNRKGEEN